MTGSRVAVAADKAWHPDPLDNTLERLYENGRWTFYTRELPKVEVAAKLSKSASTNTQKIVREDIQSAVKEAKNLIGAGKEIARIEKYLQPEEKVLAFASGQVSGTGVGVLACTTDRLLFLFSGMLRGDKLSQTPWDQVHTLIIARETKTLAVWDKKPTKKGTPVLQVYFKDFRDALRVQAAVEKASKAPRITTAS